MRKIQNYSMLTQQPCGGSQRASVHYVSTPGSRNFISWKILHPSQNGTCILRIGQGADEDTFKVLFPLDKSANKKGAFPCGREETAVDGKEFIFPANFTCDSCTIQWEWTTHLG